MLVCYRLFTLLISSHLLINVCLLSFFPSLLPSCVAWTSLIVTLLSVYRHVLPSCLGQFAFNAGCLCRLILGPLLCCLYVVFVSTNKQAHMSKHLCTSLLKRRVHPVCFLPLCFCNCNMQLYVMKSLCLTIMASKL